MLLDDTRTRSLRAECMSTVEPCYCGTMLLMTHVLDHQRRTYVYCGTMLLDDTRTRSLRAECMSTVEPCYWMLHVLSLREERCLLWNHVTIHVIDHSEKNVCLLWNHVTG